MILREKMIKKKKKNAFCTPNMQLHDLVGVGYGGERSFKSFLATFKSSKGECSLNVRKTR